MLRSDYSKMKPAPIPKNEKQRLRDLYDLDMLDTPPEERFDRITLIATLIFNVPISTVTLVDSKRQWFKSCVGLDVKETPRAISFCGHAIDEPDCLIIEDTKKDTRFANNPLVVKSPNVRFYAGVPLNSVGKNAIGVFCIQDTKPRKLTDKDLQILKALAKWAELELNLHNLGHAIQDIKKLEKQDKLLQKRKLENKLLNEKYDFIAMVSHQLRTPVGVIRNILAVVSEDIKDQKKAQALDYSVRDLNDLIGSLIYFVEHKDKNFKIKPEKLERINIIQSIRGTVSLLEKNILDKKVTVKESDIQKDLFVNADKVLLNRVLYCLIKNAIDYNKEFGSIEIKVAKVNAFIKTEIIDTGYGLPSKEQKKVFSRLFRATNASLGKNEGSGVSLYLIKHVVESLNGEIGFESQENEGSTFYFTLPAA